MKEQYVGDVNDYRKYALLRHLAGAAGLRIGVCWMLTPPDAGNLRHYLNEPDKWRVYDTELFDQLRTIIALNEGSRLPAVEASGIMPAAYFFNEQLTDRSDRTAYFRAALEALNEADLVFFDPDNGIAPRKADAAIPKSGQRRRAASKFIFIDEIALAFERGHSVLVYQHFPHVPRDQFIGQLAADLSQHAPAARIWCFRTPFAAFLLLGHPKHAAGLDAAATDIPSHWRPRFIDCRRLPEKAD